ncbi:hypothetical protein BDQ17DRAFT_529724 [Cyathus striatus]|nr:hypothetical protein BDQ17DRAFT_529724 [Cyathus striatus]
MHLYRPLLNQCYNFGHSLIEGCHQIRNSQNLTSESSHWEANFSFSTDNKNESPRSTHFSACELMHSPSYRAHENEWQTIIRPSGLGLDYLRVFDSCGGWKYAPSWMLMRQEMLSRGRSQRVTYAFCLVHTRRSIFRKSREQDQEYDGYYAVLRRPSDASASSTSSRSSLVDSLIPVPHVPREQTIHSMARQTNLCIIP